LHKEKSFTITIIPFTALPNYADQFDCNSYTLPADTNGGIYYSGTNKGLPILTPGTIITSTKSIFYKETATIPLNCIAKMFTVYIGLQVSLQLMLTLVLPIHLI
jgi:hypothetical protein